MVLLQCAFAALGGAAAGLAGVGGFLQHRGRRQRRQPLPEGGREEREVTEATQANGWRDGQLAVLRHEEGIVCVRVMSKGPAVALSEFFADTDYPGRSVFVVRHAPGGHVNLLPLLAPGMALAATGDSKGPLEVQRVRAKADAQLWSQASLGFVCAAPGATIRLIATAMQPVPAEKVSTWIRKVAQEAALVRQNEALEQQLAESDRFARQVEKQARSLSMQLEQDRQQHVTAQQQLGAELEEACRARRELEAGRGVAAEQQAAQSRDQELLMQQLSTAQLLIEQLQRQMAALEQQGTAAAATIVSKDQQVSQLSQQVSNLQVAFDFVRATAADRQEELQLWKDKHAKLDTALQAIKARMRMVNDGDQQVKRLQASGVLRQADLRQLKQRLQRLGHQVFDETSDDDHDVHALHAEGGDDLELAPDTGRAREAGDQHVVPTAAALLAALQGGRQTDAAGAHGSAGADAVEEVVRALQYESQYGSMEALLRSTGGGSTDTVGASGKADSLAAWFGRSSKASARSTTADSAGSSSSVLRAGGAQQLGSKIPRYIQSEGGSKAASEQRLPHHSPSEVSVGSAVEALTLVPGTGTPFINNPTAAAAPQRPWVRPSLIVPHDDDAVVNMASTRHPGVFVAPSAPGTGATGDLSARGGLTVLTKQGTPRQEQGLAANAEHTPGRSACTPTSNQSNNEEYDMLSEDNDGYDPGLSPGHHVPGSMLLAELETIKLMSSGKRQPPAIGDDEDDGASA